MAQRPITQRDFADAMRALGPFETAPHLAVAVSGGADSLALTLLANDWARALGGRVTALTVDHGLRIEAADEARQVADWLHAFDIEHVTLRWDGDKPTTAVQAKARAARYRLLNDWCAQAGVLHLLVAHHADDQSETMLMRWNRGSGPDGLAAMAPVRELASCRILRPLLGFRKRCLVAFLEAQGQAWIEDPSNTDTTFERVRVRSAIAEAEMDVAALSQSAGRLRRARTALEAETARWLGRYAETSPLGWLKLDAQAFGACDGEIRLRVLARAAHHIGGRDFPPAIDAVERLAARIADGTGATLGGAAFQIQDGALHAFREARNLPSPMDVSMGSVTWDRRFLVCNETEGSVRIAALGRARLRAWPVDERPKWMRDVPALALASLPVVEGGSEKKHPPRVPMPGGGAESGVFVSFRPKMPLSGSGFAIA